MASARMSKSRPRPMPRKGPAAERDLALEEGAPAVEEVAIREVAVGEAPAGVAAETLVAVVPAAGEARVGEEAAVRGNR